MENSIRDVEGFENTTTERISQRPGTACTLIRAQYMLAITAVTLIHDTMLTWASSQQQIEQNWNFWLVTTITP